MKAHRLTKIPYSHAHIASISPIMCILCAALPEHGAQSGRTPIKLKRDPHVDAQSQLILFGALKDAFPP